MGRADGREEVSSRLELTANVHLSSVALSFPQYSRFVDPSLGFALGYNYCMSWPFISFSATPRLRESSTDASSFPPPSLSPLSSFVATGYSYAVTIPTELVACALVIQCESFLSLLLPQCELNLTRSPLHLSN